MIMDIVMRPVEGEFEVAQIAGYLERQPFTARDVHDVETFMIADDAPTLEEAQAARVTDSRHFPYTVILISVHAASVSVAYRCSEPLAARRFVEWMLTQHRLRFFDDDYGGEVTERVTCNLDYLFT